MIFSTHPLHPEVTAALQALGPFRVASAPTAAAITAESIGAEVIVVRAPIPPDVVRREAGLKALLRHGAGLDMIPVEVATEAGVLVANVPGANALTVAEHVIWSAMALLRRYPQVDRDLRSAGWAAGRWPRVSPVRIREIRKLGVFIGRVVGLREVKRDLRAR